MQEQQKEQLGKGKFPDIFQNREWNPLETEKGG